MESDWERIQRRARVRGRMLRAAAGEVPAELVLKNAAYVNVFSN